MVLNATKKPVYISLVKAQSLYINLHWQASSDYGREVICRRFVLLATSVGGTEMVLTQVGIQYLFEVGDVQGIAN